VTVRPALIALVAALALAGCGPSKPASDPGDFALSLTNRILANKYTEAWGDLYEVDQKVAPLSEYVGCETRSPVIARPRSVKVVSVNTESVGLGDGKFVESTAVDIRMGFAGSFSLVHTVHLVAEDGRWKWILPSWRFRDYKADRCPTDSGSSPAPSNA
jgi:hypothetical protein